MKLERGDCISGNGGFKAQEDNEGEKKSMTKLFFEG